MQDLYLCVDLFCHKKVHSDMQYNMEDFWSIVEDTHMHKYTQVCSFMLYTSAAACLPVEDKCVFISGGVSR